MNISASELQSKISLEFEGIKPLYYPYEIVKVNNKIFLLIFDNVDLLRSPTLKMNLSSEIMAENGLGLSTNYHENQYENIKYLP